MQIIKDIFDLPEGAVWLKADLHVHTPVSKDFSEKWADSTAEDVVRIALEKQLDIIDLPPSEEIAHWVRLLPNAFLGVRNIVTLCDLPLSIPPYCAFDKRP